MNNLSQLLSEVYELETRINELQRVSHQDHDLRIHALKAILRQKRYHLKKLGRDSL